MKKIIPFLVGLCFLNWTLEAQEQAAFTHYHVNHMLINPAAAGATDNHQVFLHARNQWAGFPGSPKTFAASYDGPIGKSFGLGAIVYSENIASMNQFRAAINYAFRFEVDKLKVGFGFSTEFSQMQLDGGVLEDPNTFQGDLFIEDGVAGINQFDATLGFYGLYNDQTFFGIAFPNIIMARLDGTTNDSRDNQGYYAFNIGHRFKSSEYGFTLEPSLLLRQTRGVPFQADINLKGYFLEDKLIGGLSYRGGSRGALGLLVGTTFNNFSFHYSFDVSFQGFQQYSNGAHEITLGIRLPKRVKKAPALQPQN
ncbi:MAG: PorP/SprF family type IX secretion system membrane protein [Bacteroidota bacterium]